MLNLIFNLTNEIKCIAFLNKWIKNLPIFEYINLGIWFCPSFSSGKGKRQELCTRLSFIIPVCLVAFL